MTQAAQLIRNHEREFFPAAAVARLLGCSEKTIHRLYERGELDGIRFGARGWLRIKRESVYALLERHCRPGPS